MTTDELKKGKEYFELMDSLSRELGYFCYSDQLENRLDCLNGVLISERERRKEDLKEIGKKKCGYCPLKKEYWDIAEKQGASAERERIKELIQNMRDGCCNSLDSFIYNKILAEIEKG